MDSSAHSRVMDKLRRDLGEGLLNAIEDPATLEVMLNPDGEVWVEKMGHAPTHIPDLGMSSPKAEAVIRTVAGALGKEVHVESPCIECELPLDGSRFAGQLPPVVHAPTFTIRKRASTVFSLEDYRKQGAISSYHAQMLIEAGKSRKNILVVGGTGSGKTTLVNALIHSIVRSCVDDRLIIIEDTGEIQCAARNAVLYHTSPTVSMTDLLRTSLRMRPDRILVGEVRGPEALDLLDAWNTGHPGGVATLHANDALSGLSRLSSLISRNPHAPARIEPLIAEAVDFVVCIEKTNAGRRVTELIAVTGFDGTEFITKTLEGENHAP